MIPMGYEYKVENNVRSFDLNYILDKRGKEGWLLCTLNIIKKRHASVDKCSNIYAGICKN